MHEMTIVTSILQVVEGKAREGGATVINSIVLEVGQLAGVELDSLRFCFEAARKGGMADQAELVVVSIPGQGTCPDCGKDVPLEYAVAPCPACGKTVVEASHGRELRIKSINVD
jgi:hydrogenase nickel incorporation protein HypA/HybF